MIKNLMAFITISQLIVVAGFGQCDISFSYDDPACAGMCNGQIAASPSGSAPFSYDWSTGDTTATIDSLCEGTYTLTITDDTGCMHTDSVTIIEPDTFIVIANYISGTSGPGWGDGFIGLTVSGGTPDYTYNWKDCVTDNDVWSSPFFFAGEYYCIAEDNNGCIDTTDCITVSDPVVGISNAKKYDQFEVFPNPFLHSTTFTLPTTNTQLPLTLHIYDQPGREIRTEAIQTPEFTFYRNDLKAGVYYYRINNYTGKFIIAD